jgi:hypothetical protein
LLSEGGRDILALVVGMDVAPVDRVFVHFHNNWCGQLRLPVIQRNNHIVLIALAGLEDLLVLLCLTED